MRETQCNLQNAQLQSHMYLEVHAWNDVHYAIHSYIECSCYKKNLHSTISKSLLANDQITNINTNSNTDLLSLYLKYDSSSHKAIQLFSTKLYMH